MIEGDTAIDEKVELVRSAIPEIALSTDVIVAFPGETEEEYLTTIEEELFEGMDELPDLVLAFIEEELG